MDNARKAREETSHRRIILPIGVSPEALGLFSGIARRFNSLGFHLRSGEIVTLEVSADAEDHLMELAARGDLAAFSPVSSVWLSQTLGPTSDIDQRPPRVEEVAVFAVSPVVLGVSPKWARRVGYPDKVLSWRSCFLAAEEDEAFRWAHPHPRSIMGQFTFMLLQAFATEETEDGSQEEREERIRHRLTVLESRVERYGPSDLDVVDYAFADGEWVVDAFVAQEHVVVAAFEEADLRTRPVLVYPDHHNPFMDHPLVTLALPEKPGETAEAYRLFRDYLFSADAQFNLLQHGFRAADERSGAYFAAPEIPEQFAERRYRPVLKLSSTPTAEVLKGMVSDSLSAKRRAVVYLVADTSGSMRGSKIERAKEGMLEFLAHCDPEDLIGLVAFSDFAHDLLPPGRVRDNIETVRQCIHKLSAGGQTALLDAASLAHKRLQVPMAERPIRAIVLLTDGQENASKLSESALDNAVRAANRGPFPVAVFALAYGETADVAFLERVARWPYGKVLEGRRDNIVRLYKMLAGFV